MNRRDAAAFSKARQVYECIHSNPPLFGRMPSNGTRMAIRKAMRKPAVLAALGCSNSTLYANIKAGLWPSPTKLNPGGQTSIWWEDEIEAVQKGEWKPAEAVA